MDSYVRDTCKIGQGNSCCRYLVCGANGFECSKLTTMKETIDLRVDSMTAKSDNCDGVAGLISERMRSSHEINSSNTING